MVRAEGIEPSIQAWEAHVLPLYYARENGLKGMEEGRLPSASGLGKFVPIGGGGTV